MVSFEKYKTVSFTSSIMTNVIALSCARSAVNVICVLAFGAASSSCYLFKSIAMNL